MKDIIFYLSSDKLKDVVDSLIHCVSKEETRYYLCGICFEYTKNELTAVATDGHRIGTYNLDEYVVENEETNLVEFSAIIPTEACKHISKIFGNQKDASIRISVGGKAITFSSNAPFQEFTIELINGTYPDWREFVPNFDDATVIFKAKYLLEVLKCLGSDRTSISVKDEKSPVSFKSEDNEGLSYVVMPCIKVVSWV